MQSGFKPDKKLPAREQKIKKLSEQPITNGDRKTLFALYKRFKIPEPKRHHIQQTAAGKQSLKDFTRLDVKKLINYLNKPHPVPRDRREIHLKKLSRKIAAAGSRVEAQFLKLMGIKKLEELSAGQLNIADNVVKVALRMAKENKNYSQWRRAKNTPGLEKK